MEQLDQVALLSGSVEEEQSNYYEGLSNEIVWPLFHDLQSRCNFDPNYWEFYERVNRKFADAAEEASKPGDLIWILMMIQSDAGGQEARCAAGVRAHGSRSFFTSRFPRPISLPRTWRTQILEDRRAPPGLGCRPGATSET